MILCYPTYRLKILQTNKLDVAQILSSIYCFKEKSNIPLFGKTFRNLVRNALQLRTFFCLFHFFGFERHWWVFCRGNARLAYIHNLVLISMMSLFIIFVTDRIWHRLKLNHFTFCSKIIPLRYFFVLTNPHRI